MSPSPPRPSPQSRAVVWFAGCLELGWVVSPSLTPPPLRGVPGESAESGKLPRGGPLFYFGLKAAEPGLLSTSGCKKKYNEIKQARDRCFRNCCSKIWIISSRCNKGGVGGDFTATFLFLIILPASLPTKRAYGSNLLASHSGKE